MLGKILLSLTLTSLVSCLAGFLFPDKFWISFSLAFILQVLFFYFFNSIYENNLVEKAQRLKLEELKEQNKQTANLQCPCDEKTRQDIALRFDEDVIYKCGKCGKNLKAIVNVKTIQTTDPIYFDDRPR